MDSDVITDVQSVHPVGVFAQITSIFSATSGNGVEGSGVEGGGVDGGFMPTRGLGSWNWFRLAVALLLWRMQSEEKRRLRFLRPTPSNQKHHRTNSPNYTQVSEPR